MHFNHVTSFRISVFLPLAGAESSVLRPLMLHGTLCPQLAPFVNGRFYQKKKAKHH
ncbi:hypothetical protein BRYFOR_09607 [Marvinbryantia formatexigens DSM 14469]|uniref:Uncharacterized protein n=1 Tax=Marvinbryantia formatexigens DSM 14469 TaxID=478749 RepID=C6LLQ9_9FIRM|nr:hypothetical protein BRYFOR_09607 [Marvinbryantia formatexigens DSM 14469]